jgi:CheY-like chemotaxis protein
MPDVIVMDINMPRMDGIEATRRSRRHQPGTVIIAVSVNDTSRPGIVAKSRRLGFVSKAEAGERLYETIMAIEPLATSSRRHKIGASPSAVNKPFTPARALSSRRSNTRGLAADDAEG